MNNKGFAISSILFLILIAFLMFLLISLEQISSSTLLVEKSNQDLINSMSFEATQVKPVGACQSGNKWYQYGDHNTSMSIVRIKTRYGIKKMWPKDFYLGGTQVSLDDYGVLNQLGQAISDDGKIKVTPRYEGGILYLKIEDAIDEYNIVKYVGEFDTNLGLKVGNICE